MVERQDQRGRAAAFGRGSPERFLPAVGAAGDVAPCSAVTRQAIACAAGIGGDDRAASLGDARSSAQVLGGLVVNIEVGARSGAKSRAGERPKSMTLRRGAASNG
ncbi:hypothetical protein [Sphingopyxis sp.]|uniref:hypothetical protein n=1 Tax=Sphingopyxis sp. TaxID=1908224 RepID=UPI0026010931|nr:hypothetical protein [Sphingopyxis sp.]